MKKRLLSLFLVLCMILPFAASCSKAPAKDDNPGTTPTDTPTNDITEVVTENATTEYVKDKFKGQDYGGYTFRIFAISPGEHYQAFIAEDSTEIWYEEDSADALQHAVFTRNLLTEDLLNVRITPIWGGNCYEIADLTQTIVKSGGDDFDLVHGAAFKQFPLAMENYFLNLYDIDNIDVKEPWWDQEYVDTYTFRKHCLYTIVGDYLTLDDYAVSVLFYNKNVVDNYNLPEPADFVDAGTWTIAKMMELAEAVTSDTNGDGQMNEDDTWGLLDNGFALVHFIEGCDAPMTQLNEEGVPEVVIDKEAFLDTVQYVFEHVQRSPGLLEQGNDDDLIVIKDDRALFYHEVLGAIYNFRDMEGDFSMLPIPKKDEMQKEYTSIADQIWCTVLSVPITVSDIPRTGAILQVLGGMSTDTVDKALYEIVLGPKLFREARTVDMLKYCLDARDFDWAKDIKWGYPIYTAINNQAAAETFAFASALQKNIKVIKAQLKKFYVGLPKT